MTARKNKGKYEVCQECGAHLDHGEECDCALAASQLAGAAEPPKEAERQNESDRKTRA